MLPFIEKCLFTQLAELGRFASPVSQVITAALSAVEPRIATRSALESASPDFSQDPAGRLMLLAFGKAAFPMAMGALDVLAGCISGGVIVPKHIPSDLDALPAAFSLIPGAHPVPDERSQTAGLVVYDFLSNLTDQDRVICLISGGGSALLTYPVDGVSLTDLQQLTHQLLACGASITEINALRKHLDRVKGGGLARSAAPAKLDTFILSDVMGNPIDAIASGPTAPDPTTYAEAWSILEKYHLESIAPAPVISVLRKGLEGLRPETLKPGAPIFRRVTHTIVADNAAAAQAAAARSQSLGWQSNWDPTPLCGEARHAGVQLATTLSHLAAQHNSNQSLFFQVLGGETTVTLQGNGLGGRNLETALAAVPILAGVKNTALITLATDGEDGPTDAAGALVTGETMQKARQMNLNPADFLARNDSYTFFQQVGGLIKTGSTCTNVNDLVFLLSYAS